MGNANKMDLVFGRSAMWDIEADLLAEICSITGDHLEVGALWGASAIIAAESKPRPWRIFSIDIMAGGYWVDGDPSLPDHPRPTARAILANFARAGVADRITLICADSLTFPLSDFCPSTSLIDAGHGAENIRGDWTRISKITERFVAIHDYGQQHPDVAAVVDSVILADPKWRRYKLANSLLVMERVSY